MLTPQGNFFGLMRGSIRIIFRKGVHLALSLKKVERERRRGRYHDSRGLYLQISRKGAKSWIFRWERSVLQTDGSRKRREHWMG